MDTRTHAKHRMMVAIIGALFLMTGSGVARAEIPSSDGVINACYDKTNGNLRVIDPTLDQCRTNERAITWSQGGTGAALAFGRIDFDGNVTLSSNLSNANVLRTNGAYCFYNIPAKNIMVTLDVSLSGAFMPVVFAEIGDPTSFCHPSGASAIVFLVEPGSSQLLYFPFFVLFH